jgi:serine/threonine protein kinase HipA of HipAB toxin-antitoxin module
MEDTTTVPSSGHTEITAKAWPHGLQIAGLLASAVALMVQGRLAMTRLADS